MSEHPNVKAVREGFDAFARGDVDGARAMLSVDAVMIVNGRHQLAGEYRGPDGILEFGAKEAELTNGKMSYQVEQVIGNDDYVFVLSRPRYEREGRVLDTLICTVCRMQDGKIMELRDLPFDPVAMDDFWA